MSTIKDVAKRAGVSTSTVSRALSNRIFVEEETRQKVLRAVEELGYRPNILAKGLKEGRTYTIAFLIPDINSLFYPEVMKSIEKYAAEKGYSTILCNNNEDIEQERHAMEMLASRGVDGILCMSVEDDISHWIKFQQEQHIPVVLVNRHFSENISCISIDNEYGGYLVTKHLLEKGHTKIAGMFGDFGRQRFRDRYFGCKRAMKEFGMTDYKKYFIYDVDNVEDAYRRTIELLERPDRPTAFFASMDMLAIGAYQALYEKGIQIPEEISVAGFDNIYMTRYMMPPLTTYAAPIDALAQKSVECLLELMNDGTKVFKETLPGVLLERSSIRPILSESVPQKQSDKA